MDARRRRAAPLDAAGCKTTGVLFARWQRKGGSGLEWDAGLKNLRACELCLLAELVV